MIEKIFKFFDKLEDKTRAKLSRKPLLYAFIGGIGMVLFWRGVWHTTDFLTAYFIGESKVVTLHDMTDGPVSFALGTIILLVTGVYVSAFIGNRLIISGLSGEKKLAEKTKEEIITESDELKTIKETLDHLEKDVHEIKSNRN
jgi:hypothetical protein